MADIRNKNTILCATQYTNLVYFWYTVKEPGKQTICVMM